MSEVALVQLPALVAISYVVIAIHTLYYECHSVARVMSLVSNPGYVVSIMMQKSL